MVAFERISPVLPVRSVKAALAYYRRLGFEAIACDRTEGEEPIYGFLRRGTVELHLALTTNLDPP